MPRGSSFSPFSLKD
jgi:hypothetical protein